MGVVREGILSRSGIKETNPVRDLRSPGCGKPGRKPADGSYCSCMIRYSKVASVFAGVPKSSGTTGLRPGMACWTVSAAAGRLLNKATTHKATTHHFPWQMAASRSEIQSIFARMCIPAQRESIETGCLTTVRPWSHYSGFDIVPRGNRLT